MTTVFTCKDLFDDMMTCVYDAWASRLGHANVKLLTEPLGTRELFCTYRHIDAQPDKAASVVRTIRQKISAHACRMVYRAAMSDQEDKLDAIYRFLNLGFYQGPSVLDCLQYPAVMRLFELDRKVSNEAHYFKEFIRFFSYENRVLSMFITTPGIAASGATNFRIMFSTYILQGSFLIAVTLFQSLGKANKATWLVLFRQIILFIPLCVFLPMIGGLGISGVWLAIALTDAVLVVITIAMMASEFRKMPPTLQALR